MIRSVCDRWWILLLHGIFAVLLGLGAVIWPQYLLLTLVILFAAFALIDGVVAIMLGIGGKPDGRAWWGMIVMGALAILAGIGALMQPAVVLIVFAAFAGISAIIRGVFEIMAAIKLRKEIEGEVFLGLSGLFSIGFGIILFVYPLIAAKAFAIVIGVYMMFLGVMAIALALRLRSVGTRLTSGA